MSRWLQQSNGATPEPDQDLPGKAMGGSFECHTCSMYVRTAYLDSGANVLAWRCTDGHVSRIKEFLS